MRRGLTISAVLHAIVLLWGLITFAPRPFEAAATDSLPVDIISATEFSQMVAGSRTAPKAPAPKPLVDKVGETKLADNPASKVAEKPEIIPTAEKQPPPPESKPEPKREAEHKQTPPKVDPIAEALKKDEAKPEPKKEEAKVPTPPRRPDPPRPQPKFDAVRIAALLDKRDPQRQASLGEMINHKPTLGTPKGAAPVLSQSEIEAFKHKVQLCWTLPAGAPNADKLRVDITIRLKRDGTLDGMPQLDQGASDTFGRAMNESAMRALIQCQPYTMFAPEKYDDWKEIPMSFDPIEMFGG
jgi:outer membrane biosynthesis protein TonB